MNYQIFKFQILVLTLITTLFGSINSVDKYMITLFGYQRSGRSCFINKFLKMDFDNFAKIGDDDGEITTYDLGYYDGTNQYLYEKEFTLIDTKGFENNLKNDYATLYSTISQITRNNSVDKIHAWLFFYSINHELNTVERDFKILKSILGEEILNHLIVIFTKRFPDNDDSFTYAEKYVNANNIRYIYLQTTCEETTQLMFAQSLVNYLDEIQKELKEKELYPYVKENLQAKLDKIEKEAVQEYIKSHEGKDKNIDYNDLLSPNQTSQIVVEYLVDLHLTSMSGSLNKIQVDLVVQQENLSLVTSIFVSIIPVAIYYIRKIIRRRQ
jgi:hypothetical protein